MLAVKWDKKTTKNAEVDVTKSIKRFPQVEKCISLIRRADDRNGWKYMISNVCNRKGTS